MNAAFPFGHPGPTALYLVLYAVTLAAHLVAIGYVLAGTGLCAAQALGRGGADSPSGRVAALLRDWLPFAVGAAITLGVAPLLFVQILYREGFYTANLLLFHRWMAMVPALVVGFYLLYAVKARRAARWPPAARAALSLVALACFAFAAYSWTENHALSLDRARWVDHYVTGSVAYAAPGLVSRALFFAAAALPSMAVIAGWQLRGDRPGAAIGGGGGEAVLLARLSLAGIAAALSFAALYAASLPADARAAVCGPAGAPYLAAGGGGALLATAGWIAVLRRRALLRPALATATAGLVLWVLGVVAVREVLRLSRFDLETLEALYATHRRIAGAGGLWTFVVFLVVNAALIGWALTAVRRALRD